MVLKLRVCSLRRPPFRDLRALCGGGSVANSCPTLQPRGLQHARLLSFTVSLCVVETNKTSEKRRREEATQNTHTAGSLIYPALPKPPLSQEQAVRPKADGSQSQTSTGKGRARTQPPVLYLFSFLSFMQEGSVAE